jgi:para-aminobenzoate synthetase/4-amino-4-deoxychorismate lyase
MKTTLPRGPGVAVFAGGGAWLPRAGGPGATDDAVVLSDPGCTLVAAAPDEIPGLLYEVEAAQRRGCYVAGYLAYEAGAAFGLTVKPPAPDALPLAWMAVYAPGSALVIPAAEWRRLLEGVEVSRVAQALARTKPELNVSRETYIRAIERVRDYIAAGDTYQVNYTVRGRFRLEETGPGASGGATGAPGTTGQPPARVLARSHPIDPLDYFLALVVRQQVPYAAYLDLGDAQVISLSPEMFLRRDGRRLESRPMKGTRPRGATHAVDVALAYELAETEKERAENLMIVDMVRNDLGRVCRAGSVRVPVLYAVEPYRTVWQMTSTVTGDVNPRATLSDIMRAVYPGASITGAPKHHTMEIIAALETEPRGVYTGAVGLFSPGGDFTCNIAIRTIVHRHGDCLLGTGSGIVWDAEPDSEYEETLTKATFATPPAAATQGTPTATPATGAAPSPGDTGWRPDPAARVRAAVRTGGGVAEGFYLFETILLEAREGDATTEYIGGLEDLGSLSPSLTMSDAAVLERYRFCERHLARMATSAQALGLPFDPKAAQEVLLGLARVTPGAVVVRVELDATGRFSLSTREAPPAAGPPEAAQPGALPHQATAPPSVWASGAVTLLVSPFRTDPDDPFLGHKTSVRGFYNREHRRAQHQGCFDALFLNRLDRVTEGAVTNVFARFGDRWVTPPTTDGLLPGVWRAWFLAHTGAEERSLTLEELLAADEVAVGNSVRGTFPVSAVVADPVEF